MSPSPSDGLVARMEAAVGALEQEQWSEGLSLLIDLVQQAHVEGDHRIEALSRGMMSQALLQTGQVNEALDQVGQALAVAELSNDRDTIHRCMALKHSVEMLAEG